jgi:hypothetical protein
MTALLLLAAVATGILGYFYGYLRAAVGVAMFCAIALFGIRFVRQMVVVPPEPQPEDVSGYGLKYVCDVCGLELIVEKASKDPAPRHCGEAMHLVRDGGKPPLRPV